MVDHIANLRTVAGVLHAIGANTQLPESRTSATEMADCVTAAVAHFEGRTYGSEADVAQFVAERIRPLRKSIWTGTRLYAAFRDWSHARGLRPCSLTLFSAALRECRIQPGCTHDKRVWMNIDLIPGQDDDIAAWQKRAALRYIVRTGIGHANAEAFAKDTWSATLEAEDGSIASALETDPDDAVDDDIDCWEA